MVPVCFSFCCHRRRWIAGSCRVVSALNCIREGVLLEHDSNRVVLAWLAELNTSDRQLTAEVRSLSWGSFPILNRFEAGEVLFLLLLFTDSAESNTGIYL